MLTQNVRIVLIILKSDITERDKGFDVNNNYLFAVVPFSPLYRGGGTRVCVYAVN